MSSTGMRLEDSSGDQAGVSPAPVTRPAVDVVGVGRPLLVRIPETEGSVQSQVQRRLSLTCSRCSICCRPSLTAGSRTAVEEPAHVIVV